MKLTKSMISWAFYDFANTIFSAIVLTVYFPLYLTELSGANWHLGAATTASMAIAGLIVPFLGAISDDTGKTKQYLIRSTMLCIIFLLTLALSQTPWVLISIFLCSCFFYHACLVFYNSLLPVASPQNEQGITSGLGTGLGYLGVVLALPLAHFFDQNFGRPSVFVVAGILFFLFTLPLMFYVPERVMFSPKPFHLKQFGVEWKKIFATIKGLRSTPVLFLFLCGNFFVVDALNSMIFWFSVYTREVFNPGQDQIIMLLISVNTSAFIFGLISGYLTDRLGAMKIMLIAALALVLSLILMALVNSYAAFIMASVFGGAFAIAAIWTSGRKALIDLVPNNKLGEYFGLYGLTTKISIIGSLLFSILADVAGFRDALWFLVFPAATGFLFLLFSFILQRRNY